MASAPHLVEQQPAAAPSTAPNIGSTADPGAARLAELIAAVKALDADASDADLIARIAVLEQLKASCAAAQARLTHTFALQHTTRVSAHIADEDSRRYRADRATDSIARQIALARRQSPWHGRQLLTLATALQTDLRHTRAALEAGRTTEQRALAVVTELACLTGADRRIADAAIAPQLPHLGNQSTAATARGLAARLDPAAVLGKIRGAVADRHVTLRPAPHTMTRLSALLPVAHGVAVHAALHQAVAATTTAPGGDPRSRGQIMADELISRITGGAITGCDPYGVPTHTPTDTRTSTQTQTPSSSVGGQPADQPDRPHTVAANTCSNGDAVDDGLRADADERGATPEVAGVDVTTVNAAASDDECAIESEIAGGVEVAAQGEIAPATQGEIRPATVGGAASAEGQQYTGSNRARIDRTATDRICECSAGQAGKAKEPPGIQLRIIMTDRALFGDDNEPAHLHGYGPIPAPIARALLAGHAGSGTKTWIKRLYTDPTGTQLLTTDARTRLFPAAVADFIQNRDQTCRTPWCDAPIRHIDHITPHTRGGPTTITNAQGLCEACNLAKENPLWHTTRQPDGNITTHTPANHAYVSRPPSPPRSTPWTEQQPLPPGWIHIVTPAHHKYRRVA
ncbi:HNH endonuclease [Nakamurella panacisegetis]|uniref:HNH endonuclease n=1 Tax=Nakamurella panacisegetis TaxID=1090615 RepID=A0A1H0SE92_9ACTN|nr:HNH endonuclease [Nakamurella panacisegetis]SDP40044.1 HNH endonuclease [Nakamurella panacisegetis]